MIWKPHRFVINHQENNLILISVCHLPTLQQLDPTMIAVKLDIKKLFYFKSLLFFFFFKKLNRWESASTFSFVDKSKETIIQFVNTQLHPFKYAGFIVCDKK